MKDFVLDHKNVLIVDDVSANLKLLFSLLTEAGYQVRPAINGTIALAAINEIPPDLILLDISMPGLDGFEVCRRLKAHPDSQINNIPIIFISARDKTSDKIQAFKEGGVDYITKPFQAEEVLARVKVHLMIRTLQKQLETKNNQLLIQNEKLAKKNEVIMDAKKQMEYLATHDRLTGLPNRVLFMDRLAMAIELAQRNQTEVALLFIDLDGFKSINDRFGHDSGDHVLKEVSKRLESCIRQIDTVARLGGDEFLVILTNLNNKAIINSLAERILTSISQDIIVHNNKMHISGSIGVAIFPRDGNVPGELILKADKAMYAVKKKGKNGVQYYDSQVTE